MEVTSDIDIIEMWLDMYYEHIAVDQHKKLKELRSKIEEGDMSTVNANFSWLPELRYDTVETVKWWIHRHKATLSIHRDISYIEQMID